MVVPFSGWVRARSALGAVHGSRLRGRGEQFVDGLPDLGRVPAVAVVDLRTVPVADGEPDPAALDLEHATRDVPGVDAAEPDHQRGDVLRGRGVEAALRLVEVGE